MPFQSRVRGIGSWSSTVHGPNRNSAGSLAMFGDDAPGRNHL